MLDTFSSVGLSFFGLSFFFVSGESDTTIPAVLDKLVVNEEWRGRRFAQMEKA